MDTDLISTLINLCPNLFNHNNTLPKEEEEDCQLITTMESEAAAAGIPAGMQTPAATSAPAASDEPMNVEIDSSPLQHDKNKECKLSYLFL